MNFCIKVFDQRKRGIALLLAAALLAGVWITPTPARAADEDCGGLSVTADDAGDFSYDDGTNTLTITGTGKVAIKNNDALPITSTKIIVAVGAGETAQITLDGVHIDVSSEENGCAFLVESGALELLLQGDNTLKSGSTRAGLEVNAKNIASLTIDSAAASGSDAGSLTACSNGDGAGIGGGSGDDGSNITISGGTVEAYSSYDSMSHGAGIGGGAGGNGSYITISGGEVKAYSGNDGISNGAGIGGGARGNGSYITISGGKVEAFSSAQLPGNANGAGIGGGDRGNGSFIEITGGKVKAYSINIGQANGAGIGGGKGGDGSDIIISGGEVEAFSGNSSGSGAGIGGGDNNEGSNITISGGVVKAYSCYS
ncbi:hypothetical protein LJC42_04685 [Eubacteriales bacterium OttesenSCG-928-K08]|nr:hypothetical protein [Eubacteriales bacterium OttesenSCG-928-K08]